MVLNVESQDNTSDPPGGYLFDPKSLSLQLYSEAPDDLIVRVKFGASITNSTFATSSTKPLIRLILAKQNFPIRKYEHSYSYGDIWVENSGIPYQGSTPIQARTQVLVTGGSRLDVTAKCKSTTWIENSSYIFFKISRNCTEMPDILFVSAFVEADNYNSGNVDWKFAPAEPLYFNLSPYPKPIPLKDQTVVFSSLPDIYNDVKQVSAQVSSNSNLPVQVSSLTQNVCNVSQSNGQVTVNITSLGTCTLDAYAPGNAQFNESPHVARSFVIREYPKKSQRLYFNEPYQVFSNSKPFDLDIYADSKLPVTLATATPTICQFGIAGSPMRVMILRAGTCRVFVTQPGDQYYLPAQSGYATFEVYEPEPEPAPEASATTTKKAAPKAAPAPRKQVSISSSATTETVKTGSTASKTNDIGANSLKTINCVATSKNISPQTKKITGKNPICPAKYKKV